MRAVTLALIATVISAAEPRRIAGIPGNAEVVETQRLPSAAKAHRAVVLWMIAPENHPRGTLDERGKPLRSVEPYTCPEQSRGWFRRGRTRISLVDTRAQKVINSVRVVTGNMRRPEDLFDVPYLIEAGHFYAVPGVRKGREGRPKLIDLRDLDGDGRPMEFALYDMLACSGPETFVFGYDAVRDRIVHYAVHLDIAGGEAQLTAGIDRLFHQTPINPRHWHYRVLYNSGAECVFDIRLRPSRQRLEGSMRCEPKK